MPAWEWDLRGSEWLTEFSRTFSKKRVEIFVPWGDETYPEGDVSNTHIVQTVLL